MRDFFFKSLEKWLLANFVEKFKHIALKRTHRKLEKVILEKLEFEEHAIAQASAIDLKRFLAAQCHAMDKSIYLASEKANRNLRLDNQGRETQEFFIKWINTHASAFSKSWSTSLCKDCVNATNCYDCLKENCENFNSK